MIEIKIPNGSLRGDTSEVAKRKKLRDAILKGNTVIANIPTPKSSPALQLS